MKHQTERRSPDQALFRLLVDSVSDYAIFALDPEGRVASWNAGAQRIKQYEREEILGRHFSAFYTEEDRADGRPERQLRAALAEGRAEDEGWRVRRDGTRFWANVVVTALRGPDGEPLGFAKVTRDMTERRELEQRSRALFEEQAARAAAEAAAARLDVLAGASDLLASSLDYEITIANVARLAVPTLADWCAVDLVLPDGALRRVAVEHSDPARRELAVRLHERYPPDPAAPTGVHQVLRTGRPEIVAEIPDSLLAAAVRDEEQLRLVRELGLRSYMMVPLVARGEALGALTLVHAESGRRFDEEDRTLALELARRAAVAIDNARLVRELQRKNGQLEEQAVELEMQAEELQAQAAHLEELIAEAEAAGEELEERTREAEEANRAKAEFLAVMSHELRTPLNAIFGYADLLELGVHGPITPAQGNALHRIKRNQRRLLSLINDVLNFAKLEAGKVELRTADVPVAEVLAGLGGLVEPQLRARGLSLASQPCDPALRMQGDQERIEQVLLNLLSNAIKFTAPGGEIRVSCRCDDDWVRVEVRDTGCGIPAAKLETVFDPFVQVGREADEATQQGVGLGLAIGRELARAMGGDLTVESVEGAGSTFTLALRRGQRVADGSIFHPQPEGPAARGRRA